RDAGTLRCPLSALAASQGGASAVGPAVCVLPRSVSQFHLPIRCRQCARRVAWCPRRVFYGLADAHRHGRTARIVAVAPCPAALLPFFIRKGLSRRPRANHYSLVRD